MASMKKDIVCRKRPSVHCVKVNSVGQQDNVNLPINGMILGILGTGGQGGVVLRYVGIFGDIIFTEVGDL